MTEQYNSYATPPAKPSTKPPDLIKARRSKNVPQNLNGIFFAFPEMPITPMHSVITMPMAPKKKARFNI